jgi:hypothetical protein
MTDPENQESRLPAPEQLAIVPLNEMEAAELIEQYVEFVDKDGRAVHLQPQFVRHYLKRDDAALPTVTSIATTPIVLPDGTMLGGRGLDRSTGIFFAIPEKLAPMLPKRESCTPERVAEVMRFLCDEWLCDVAADMNGKAIIIACALTVLERALLPMRPAFFVTAGQRGGGKTTTIHMISMATLGLPASAAAWSPSEEERRKALFAYFGAGLPLLVWDNLKRGATVSCPSIEKGLTTEFYSDRVLSESKIKTVPAYTVQVFTGNNIAPKGDMASRSLIVRLMVDRPDPENREFRHSDPIHWTDRHRGQILAALFTVLLGNPRRRPGEHRESETRFRDWWDIIGSAVEYAAAQCGERVSFKTMFMDNDEHDEQTAGRAELLTRLRFKFANQAFNARDVVQAVNDEGESAAALKAALEGASGSQFPEAATARRVTWMLKAATDAPTALDVDEVVVLRHKRQKGRPDEFRVELIVASA